MPAVASDRRRTPRHHYCSRVRVSLEEYCGQPAVTVPGASRDVGLNGVLVRTEVEIPVGTRCTVEFPFCGARIKPAKVPATARWVMEAPTPSPHFDVGFEFAGSLEVLKPPSEL